MKAIEVVGLETRGWKVMAALSSALTVITLGELLILPYCSDTIATAAGSSVPMKCYWTFHSETVIAVFLLLLAVSQFFLQGTEARRLSAATMIGAALGGLAVMSNHVIGLCANPEMNCHVMAAFVRTTLILLIIVALVQLIRPAGFVKRHKKTF